MFPISDFEGERYLVMVTRRGVIKEDQAFQRFANVRKTGLNAIELDENDELLGVDLSDGTRDILLATREGMAVHFNETDVRPMGRNARGVRAITLSGEDSVVAMDVVEADERREVLSRHLAGVRQTHDDRRVPPHRARDQGRQGVRQGERDLATWSIRFSSARKTSC